MTETPLLTPVPRAPGTDDRAAVRRLADELLAEHADAGASVAALVEVDAVAWEAARPWVSRLIDESRDAGRGLAQLVESTVDRSPLPTAAYGPPVVWAREVGVAQRWLRRVVDDLHADATAAEQAAALRDAIERTRTVGAALRAAALAV